MGCKAEVLFPNKPSPIYGANQESAKHLLLFYLFGENVVPNRSNNEKKESEKKYDRSKEFRGSKYSGMKVGTSHNWYYDQGEWRARKVTPEEWNIYYETQKKRAGKAPEGSGAPVGTAYNWLIVAHQRVDKLDANTYNTCMEGMKFKVAHKRATNNKWSITERTQRKKVIQFLEELIQDLKEADETEEIPYTVGEKKRIYGINHKTRQELYEMAIEQGVTNRSKMSRGELLASIKRNLDGKQESKETPNADTAQKLSNKSKNELYSMAQEKSIKGRSGMKKEELINVLKLTSNQEELV